MGTDRAEPRRRFRARIASLEERSLRNMDTERVMAGVKGVPWPDAVHASGLTSSSRGQLPALSLW